MYLFAVTGLIACKDARFFDTSLGPWTPPSTFYKLLEIERSELSAGYAYTTKRRGLEKIPSLSAKVIALLHLLSVLLLTHMPYQVPSARIKRLTLPAQSTSAIGHVLLLSKLL